MCDRPATHYVTQPSRALFCGEHASEAKEGQVVNFIGELGLEGVCEWAESPTTPSRVQHDLTPEEAEI